MTDAIWRLRVSTADGTFRYQQDMGALRVDGSPVMTVEGNSDCTECTFRGDVDLAPREVVQVQYSLDGGATWQNRFKGVATEVRTPQAFIGTYKLVGLMKRLEEADARKVIAAGDLAGQVQQAVTDVLTSGQIGTVLLPTVRTLAVPAITSGRVVPNRQKVADLLKLVLCPRLEKSQVAVNADGQLVFGVPTGVLALDEASLDVQPAEWGSIAAEELVTHVLFLWPRPMGGQIRYQDGTPGPGGRPAQIVLQDPQNTISSELVGPAPPYPYGQAVLTLGVTLDSSNFTRTAASNVTVSPEATLVPIGGGPPPAWTLSGSESALWDGDRNTYETLTPDASAGGYTFMQVALAYPAGLGIPIGLEWAADNATLTALGVNDGSRALFVQAPTGNGGYFLIPDEVRAVLASSTSSSGPTLTFSLTIPDTRSPVLLRAASLLWADPAFTGPLVAAATRTPAAAAGSVTVNGWPDPQPYVTLQRRGPAGEALDLVTLPASYMYRVNAGGALETEVRLGQRDKPADSVNAALIKMRDQAAALRAIRISSSS